MFAFKVHTILWLAPLLQDAPRANINKRGIAGIKKKEAAPSLPPSLPHLSYVPPVLRYANLPFGCEKCASVCPKPRHCSPARPIFPRAEATAASCKSIARVCKRLNVLFRPFWIASPDCRSWGYHRPFWEAGNGWIRFHPLERRRHS